MFLAAFLLTCEVCPLIVLWRILYQPQNHSPQDPVHLLKAFLSRPFSPALHSLCSRSLCTCTKGKAQGPALWQGAYRLAKKRVVSVTPYLSTFPISDMKAGWPLGWINIKMLPFPGMTLPLAKSSTTILSVQSPHATPSALQPGVVEKNNFESRPPKHNVWWGSW